MQMYLLEGVSRWNMDRREAAKDQTSKLRCYDTKLVKAVNQLCEGVLAAPLLAQEEEFDDTGQFP